MRDIERHPPAVAAARRRGVVPGPGAALMVVLLAACSLDDVVGGAELPSDLSDPAATRTHAGALAAYRGTLAQFRAAVGGDAQKSEQGAIAAAGLLSDELQAAQIGTYITVGSVALDIRVLPEHGDPATEAGLPYRSTYSPLQKVRGQAAEAIGLLRDYAPDASPALRGHVYALQGYAEVLLAELFCSGVPLSTLDYGGDYTLRAGSSTAEVLEHARALFDTALALSADSARLLGLARVGKARALLGLGQFQQAAEAVAEVPDGFRYEVSYTAADGANATNFAALRPASAEIWDYTVGDREGANGLDYLGSGDPRTAATIVAANMEGVPLYHPNKYAVTGDGPIVLADWVEARLIEAEAALQANDTTAWLATLNRLRRTAIAPALADTTDPGTPEGRVDLLFRERAFWLFLTGHRQGDMRRLVRQYGRPTETVYPTGMYPSSTGISYGNAVTVPVPAIERTRNPLFTGCQSRGA